MKATLFLIGTPLNEKASLDPLQNEALRSADIVIGESRNLTLKRHRDSGNESDKIFFLDNLKANEEKDLFHELRELKKTGGKVALFSDHGLPVLFDPGKQILDECRRLGFDVHTVTGPASWAVACAASGYLPPFTLVGFPPQKAEARKAFFQSIKRVKSHQVLLETPYRFKTLLAELSESADPKAEVFLAWEIATPQEWLFWGTPRQLAQLVKEKDLNKGEFVIILKASG